MSELIIIILFSYLLGSIPFGYILTKIFLNKDIRNIGSGNIGATNVLRTGNKSIGYATLMLDLSKAILPMIYTKVTNNEYLFLVGFCIFIGHIFPIWLKFKGGKGIAAYIGILFCINYSLGLIFITIWIVIFIIFKYSSLSSLISSLLLPFFSFFFIKQDNLYFFVIMFILIFFTHRENIKRLINKTEPKSQIY